jgi:hypothetical protein
MLKVPTRGEARRECALFEAIGAGAAAANAFLVPVAYLRLERSGREQVRGAERSSGGILMPFYFSTLAQYPPPLSAA